MSNQRLTQCPHCKASFKVSEEQLNAANGRVRCGACMNIFDAIAYSVTSTENIKSTSESLKKTEPAIDLEESLLETEENLFADNPEEDLDDPGYSGNNKDDEFSTSFLELDSADSSDPYSTAFKEVDDDFVVEENNEAIDESWTQDILNDINEPKDQKVEPKISSTPHSEPLSSRDTADSQDSSLSDPFSSPADYEPVEFHYEQDRPEGSRHWFVSLLFIFANLTLITTLLGQALWFHYEKLVKFPQIENLYQLACEQLGCTLPKLEDISQIKSNNLIVRSHPIQRKSLIIDTVIVNEASYDQAFPDLALYFSDINKKIVAQRLFKPSEYLSGDLANWKTMPVSQPIQISLEIIDPGKEAVNYSLKFFSPKL